MKGRIFEDCSGGLSKSQVLNAIWLQRTERWFVSSPSCLVFCELEVEDKGHEEGIKYGALQAVHLSPRRRVSAMPDTALFVEWP